MIESCPTYKWVMSLIWLSHVPRTNESCHSYDWVTSRVRMSHVTHTNRPHPWPVPTRPVGNESRHIFERVRMSHVPRTNTSRHTCEWATIYVWVSHVTHTNESRPWPLATQPAENESRHTHEHVTSQICMSHVTCMNAPCQTCLTWRIHTCDETRHMFDMAYTSYVIRVTSHVTQKMSHVTHMNTWRQKYAWVTSHVWMRHVIRHTRHVTHTNASRHTYKWGYITPLASCTLV